jgi:hypothetical protein
MTHAFTEARWVGVSPSKWLSGTRIVEGSDAS